MNNFEDWSQIISKYLKSEADPLGSLTKHELEGDAARVAFIRSVLDRFLPEIYGVGSGQIMDCKGELSGKLDIIIYRRDFPRLDLPGSRDIYLYESVIATAEVAAKLVKKSFFEALDRCASLAELSPDIDHKVMTGLATRNQLTMNENRQYVHPDPIRTARFHLIGRPISFIYAFSGYKTSPNQLADTMRAWMDDRRENHLPVEMKDLPAVVATQGCFAWRNSAPLTVNEHSLMGIGVDQAPVRLIVLQMLHVISRRLKVTTDGYGLKPGLDGYLNRMPPPQMESFIGKARNPVVGAEAIVEKQVRRSNAPVPAVDKPVVAKSSVPKKPIVERKPVAQKPVVEAVAKPSVAPKPAAVKPVEAKAPVAKPEVNRPEAVNKPVAVPTSAAKPVTEAKPGSEIEIKARPSISKPAVDRAVSSKPAAKPPAANLLGSLSPKPEAVDAPFPIPNADLIPKLDPNPVGSDVEESDDKGLSFGKLEDPVVPKSADSKLDDQKSAPTPTPPARPTLNAVPKKTPVDIELSPDTTVVKSDSVTAVDTADSFLETVKMQLSSMPEAQKKANGSSNSSADDFIETVKQKMASPEPIPHLQPESEPQPEPFTSTIPQ